MTSFSEEMRRRGLRPGSKTLSLDIKHAGAYLGRCLHVSPSERIVVAKRLRLADDESMAIETLHVPRALVPGLTREDFDHTSFYDLLTDRYGIEIVGGIQTIEPTVTNEEESEILGVPLHSPAFQFERTTRSETGDDRRVRPVDLSRRPLPARHGAQPARALRCGAGVPPARAGVVTTAAAAEPHSATPGAVLLAEIRSSLPRCGGSWSTPTSTPRPRRRQRGAMPPHPARRPRLLRQRRFLRHLRLRPPARLDRAAGLDLAVRVLRRPARPARLDRRCALAVRPYAGCARIRRAREGERCLHGRGHERSRFLARGGRRGDVAARCRCGTRNCGDEDLHHASRCTGPPRRERSRPR